MGNKKIYLKNIIISIFLSIMFLLIPIFMTGCIDVDENGEVTSDPTTSSSGSTTGQKTSDYFSKIKVVKSASFDDVTFVGLNEKTESLTSKEQYLKNVYSSIKNLSVEVLLQLCGEYGYGVDSLTYNSLATNSVGFTYNVNPYALSEHKSLDNGSNYTLTKDETTYTYDGVDSHTNAIRLDNWIISSGLGDEVDNATFITDVFTKNIKKIISGIIDTLTGKTNLVESMKTKYSLTTDEDSYIAACQYIDHVGFTSYEKDVISEYILSNVIGTNVVAKDNTKFIDGNVNGTFDSDEYDTHVDSDGTNYTSNYKDLIKNYLNTTKKLHNIGKNTMWDSITFGQNDTLDLDNATIKDTRKSTYVIASNDPTIVVYNPTTQTFSISGFKNYVNTIYSIINNITGRLAKDENDNDVSAYPTFAGIEYNDYDLSKFSMSTSKENDEQYLAADKYKSFIFEANQDLLIKSIGLAFEVDPNELSEGENSVSLDVIGRYYGCVDSSSNHNHSSNCSNTFVEFDLGTISITPGLDKDPMTDAASIVCDLDENSNNDFSKLKINGAFLSKFVNNTVSDSDLMLDIINSKYFNLAGDGGVYGTRAYYNDTTTRYFELAFNITSVHKNPINFRICMFLLDYEEI
jgi:hypothetical protein